MLSEVKHSIQEHHFKTQHFHQT